MVVELLSILVCRHRSDLLSDVKNRNCKRELKIQIQRIFNNIFAAGGSQWRSFVKWRFLKELAPIWGIVLRRHRHVSRAPWIPMNGKSSKIRVDNRLSCRRWQGTVVNTCPRTFVQKRDYDSMEMAILYSFSCGSFAISLLKFRWNLVGTDWRIGSY